MNKYKYDVYKYYALIFLTILFLFYVNKRLAFFSKHRNNFTYKTRSLILK